MNKFLIMNYPSLVKAAENDLTANESESKYRETTALRASGEVTL